jgi:hypothetical protein
MLQVCALVTTVYRGETVHASSCLVHGSTILSLDVSYPPYFSRFSKLFEHFCMLIAFMEATCCNTIANVDTSNCHDLPMLLLSLFIIKLKKLW